MSEQNGYQQLAPRQGSRYRQYFVVGTRIRAEVLYRETVGPDARSPEEVARDYDVPLAAVMESIDYSERNEALLRQERDEDQASIEAHGWDRPPHVPVNGPPRP